MRITTGRISKNTDSHGKQKAKEQDIGIGDTYSVQFNPPKIHNQWSLFMDLLSSSLSQIIYPWYLYYKPLTCIPYNPPFNIFNHKSFSLITYAHSFFSYFPNLIPLNTVWQDMAGWHLGFLYLIMWWHKRIRWWKYTYKQT